MSLSTSLIVKEWGGGAGSFGDMDLFFFFFGLVEKLGKPLHGREEIPFR